MNANRQQQIREFLALHRFDDAELLPLAGDASFRRYIRIRKGSEKAMLMDAPPEKENVRPFVTLAEHLYRQGYSTPKVLGADAGAGLLLLEDLGDDLFTAVLKRGGDSDLEQTLYAAAIDVLTEWHTRKAALVSREALSLPDYDEKLLLPEVGLLADWYLPQVVGKEKAADLKREYMAIWKTIIARAKLANDHLVHRDYHADNLMWLPERQNSKRVGLLDFQDGVYGDAAYDLVSLLEDARRDVPEPLVKEMLARYLAATGMDKTAFMQRYAVLAAQRNCKIVGIFVRLAARDNKYNYLGFLPRVWRYLEHDITHPALAELKAWLDTHVPKESRGAVEVKHTSRELALSA
jgi:N-acetylmuramate 1-kinase